MAFCSDSVTRSHWFNQWCPCLQRNAVNSISPVVVLSQVCSDNTCGKKWHKLSVQPWSHPVWLLSELEAM
jgi:hypothetical protein